MIRQTNKPTNLGLNPLAKAIKCHIGSQRSKLIGAALVSGSMTLAPFAYSAEIEEVIVTAQKREANVQDVPMNVTVFDNQKLEDLNITGFDDYILHMTNMTYESTQPGVASVYMRGIYDGSGNSSNAGNSVSIYFDEQPVTSIGRNLDVYIYDIARIETLAGPQGTLFGANSQSGVLRIIPNKPDPTGFEAGFDTGLNTVKGGDVGYVVKGFVNQPLGDRAAIRLVAWYEEEGGYIDNVAATNNFAFSSSVAGVPIGRSNAGLVEDDFNESESTGLRAALRIDLNDSWTITPTVMYQKQDNKGVWDHDPDDFGDLNVARFFEDSNEDEWIQTALKVEGEFGGMNLVYSGSYLDRDVEWSNDYSEYSDYYLTAGFVEAYYSCYVSYFGTCDDPSMNFLVKDEYKRSTHEIRLSSAQDQRLRWIAGVFYEEDEHSYDQEWHIPAMTAPVAVDGTDIYFTTDQKRTEEEFAVFGEVYFDLNDSLTATFGARWFDHESTMKGFVGTYWWPNRFGPRTSDNVDTSFSEDDVILKFGLAWDIGDDAMVYATWSEGYRPGGANRLAIPGAIGESYDSDVLTNYELGWKTILADGRFRFNGAVYYEEWDDFQFSQFDNTVSLLGLVQNAGNAEVWGIELDAIVNVNDNFTIFGSVAATDGETTEDFFNARQPAPGAIPDAPDGTELPFTPSLKLSLTARYDFKLGEWNAFAQGTYTHVGESWNQLEPSERKLQDEYSIANISFGIDQDMWALTAYVNNVEDERAELNQNFYTWDNRVTTNRPRSYGVNFKRRF
ncbi:MAG: TonB-dependent receptor [Gammaproteobacteria bacterium]|nr:MAG: TonB-dependent receptor [Gammaproteobacteria bacterium]